VYRDGVLMERGLCMKLMVALGACLMMSGCMMFSSMDATPAETHEATPDISLWTESSEAAAGCILINGYLDSGLAGEVADKILTLDQRKEVERITLLINSLGGEAVAFRVIHNALRLTRKPVDAVNFGNCYSAACAVFASATGKSYAYANSHFMVHRPQMPYGTPKEVRDMLDFEVQTFESVIKGHGNLPAEWFPLTDRDRFFTAQQALEYKFVDAVIDGPITATGPNPCP
jgi:ATP-dependent Clp protease protease subunit